MAATAAAASSMRSSVRPSETPIHQWRRNSRRCHTSCEYIPTPKKMKRVTMSSTKSRVQPCAEGEEGSASTSSRARLAEDSSASGNRSCPSSDFRKRALDISRRTASKFDVRTVHYSLHLERERPFHMPSHMNKQRSIADIAEHQHRRWREKPWWIIDPRVWRFTPWWDFATTFAVIFIAVVTPYEISLLSPPKEVDFLFVANRLIDVICFMDVCLGFVFMYSEETQDGPRWVFEPCQIWRNYLCSWFLVDVVALLVSSMDFLAIYHDFEDEPFEFKILRAARVLRVLKLGRLLRVEHVFKQWEARMSINYSVLSFSRVITSVILAGHWFACMWSLQTRFYSGAELLDTWLGNIGLCHGPYTRDQALTFGDVVDCGEDGRCSVCRTHPHLYFASLYWAIMTITSIGYGDVHPILLAEQALAVVVMLVGSILWGQVIATFCNVVNNVNPERTEFRRTMDELNRFMRINRLSSITCQRLREYFHQTKHLKMLSSGRNLMLQMSPLLQAEISWAINRQWLTRVWFLRNAEPSFVLQLSLSIVPVIFVPSELAPHGFLYVVHRGIALYGGKVLTAGDVWGEDLILNNVDLRSKWCARAMNYLETFNMSRDRLIEISLDFPETAKLIRRHAILLALRRFLLSYHRQEKNSTWGRVFNCSFPAKPAETPEAKKEVQTPEPARDVPPAKTPAREGRRSSLSKVMRCLTGSSSDKIPEPAPEPADSEEAHEAASYPLDSRRASNFARNARPSAFGMEGVHGAGSMETLRLELLQQRVALDELSKDVRALRLMMQRQHPARGSSASLSDIVDDTEQNGTPSTDEAKNSTTDSAQRSSNVVASDIAEIKATLEKLLTSNT